MLTLAEASKYLSLHPKTLQRLDRLGILKASRTPSNRREYPPMAIQAFKEEQWDKFEKKVYKVVDSILKEGKTISSISISIGGKKYG